MQQLTLTLKDEVAGRAKQLAEQQGVSVSEVFTQFIESVPSRTRSDRIPPAIREAIGMFKLPEGKTVEELLEEVKAERAERHLR